MHLVTVVAPEMARLGCECPELGYCFTVETAKEYKAENFEIEYCEKVSRGGTDSDIVKFKTLPEYPDAIWNQEDPEKWLTTIQVRVRK